MIIIYANILSKCQLEKNNGVIIIHAPRIQQILLQQNESLYVWYRKNRFSRFGNGFILNELWTVINELITICWI